MANDTKLFEVYLQKVCDELCNINNSSRNKEIFYDKGNIESAGRSLEADSIFRFYICSEDYALYEIQIRPYITEETLVYCRIEIMNDHVSPEIVNQSTIFLKQIGFLKQPTTDIVYQYITNISEMISKLLKYPKFNNDLDVVAELF